MRKTKSSFFVNLCILLLALLIFFVILEIVLQVLSPAQVLAQERWIATGDARNYDNIPQLHYVNGVDYYLNAQGMRALKNYSEKEGYRIAVLGDSVTFGHGVENNETFSYLLEREIGVEVLNFGVSGYSMKANVYALQEKALSFNPDLVLLTVVMNDIEPSLVPFKTDEESTCILPFGIQVPCTYKNLIRKSKVIHFFYSGFNNLFYAQVQDYYTLSWGSEMLYEGNIAAPLSMFSEICTKEKISCAVVVFPLLQFNATHYPWEEQEEKLIKEIKLLGFNSLLLRGVFQEYTPKELGAVQDDILHPNVFGHKIVAEEIINFINSQGYLHDYGEQVVIG